MNGQSTQAKYTVIEKRTAPSTKAPGPDGFRLSAWKRSSKKMLDWIGHTFNLCLKDGVFPAIWKCANLVLIPKAVKPNIPEGNLPKVRPICLLEIGKAFERIIAERIAAGQMGNAVSDLSANQFGFRRQRSTCDALLLVKEITSTAVMAVLLYLSRHQERFQQHTLAESVNP